MTASDSPVDPTGTGVVLESLGGVYYIQLESGARIQASLRGRLRKQVRVGDRVVAGDRVRVAPGDRDDGGDERWTVEEVLPRHAQLVRAGPGGRKPKIVAANVDRMVAVLSAADPPFRPETADRFLVLAEVCGLEPCLVINKMDLPGVEGLPQEVSHRYRGSGYPIIFASVEAGEGLDTVREVLSTGMSILAGPSGVGKSSILNAIAPGLGLRTGTVSRKVGRGRHTTVSARLLEIPGGGWVVDTPGFSEVDLWEVDPAALPGAFPELAALAPECRFRGCSHTHEPDCAVKGALERGDLDASRYESYLALVS